MVTYLLWLKLTPTYLYEKDNDVWRKSTPLSLRKELKKITVWIVCNTIMNVVENSMYE